MISNLAGGRPGPCFLSLLNASNIMTRGRAERILQRDRLSIANLGRRPLLCREGEGGGGGGGRLEGSERWLGSGVGGLGLGGGVL